MSAVVASSHTAALHHHRLVLQEGSQKPAVEAKNKTSVSALMVGWYWFVRWIFWLTLSCAGARLVLGSGLHFGVSPANLFLVLWH